MFEDQQIQSIPLALDSGRPQEKAGEGWALIIVDTTRGNTDWLDVSEQDVLKKIGRQNAKG
jgi:hypothetical protein